MFLKVLGGYDRRAFLRAGADGPADLKVQLHLRQLHCHDLIQRLVHGAVVHGFSAVHGFLLSGVMRLIFFINANESISA